MADAGDTLDHISDGFCTLDREWRFTFLNREAERQVGRPRESLVGQVVWDAFPQLVGSIFETSYRRAMADGVMVEFEAWFEPLASWFNVRAYPSTQGLAVYFYNVTQQREAREQARISEERFRLLARATNDAIWDWNLITNETWRNQGFKTLFGHPTEDKPSIDDWTTRIHPDDRERVTTGIRRAIDGGSESWSDEYRFLRYDGRIADVFDRGYIIRDAGGRPTRMIGGMTDLTERKQLEAQFLRAQRLESIGTLAGGIAHDLNNILQPIVMVVGLLRADETSPDRLALLDTVEASGRRGADMVRQVLAFDAASKASGCRSTSGTCFAMCRSSFATRFRRTSRSPSMPRWTYGPSMPMSRRFIKS
jgi:PAS domain S-box-containing protein